MHPNRYRGEIIARLDGHERRLVLTLGTLAELEEALGCTSLAELAERFEGGRLSARDIAEIIAAGLRGAGEEVSAAEVATMRHEKGLPGLVETATRLIAVTFAPPDADPATPAADAPMDKAEGPVSGGGKTEGKRR